MMSLEEMNGLRKKFVVCLVIGIIAFIVGMFLMFKGNMAGMVSAVCGFVVIFVGVFAFARKLSNGYKETIVRTALNEMFDVKEYNPKGGLDYEYVYATHFIRTGNRYSSDDYLEANYYGVHFTRADVETQEETTDSDGDSSTTTLFEGTWTIFDLPKDVDTYILVREKQFLGGGNPFGLFGGKKVSKVSMEDVSFNDKFEVYAQDEHDAFYMLNPRFMEQLRKVEQLVDGHFCLGIMNHKLHVIFDTRSNSLEPEVLKEITHEEIDKIKESLQYIVDMIEIFELDK